MLIFYALFLPNHAKLPWAIDSGALSLGNCGTVPRNVVHIFCFVGGEFFRSVPLVSRNLSWAIDGGALFAWQLRHRAEERIRIFFAFWAMNPSVPDG